MIIPYSLQIVMIYILQELSTLGYFNYTKIITNLKYQYITFNEEYILKIVYQHQPQ